MEDYEIVDMYWSRNEKSIVETEKKYGAMLFKISDSILDCHMDAEECVNDTYLSAWKAMPTDRPIYLGAYLSKIVRNLSINRYRKNKRKRQIVTVELMDELCECISDNDHDDNVQYLSLVLNDFLRDLEKEKRVMFISRYFDAMSIEEIAKKMGIGKSKVKTTLFRVRNKLKERLNEEGLL